MPADLTPNGLLTDARVYLSGPMDFVASREEEMRFGWRNRVSQFLKAMGVTVFDPWFKPELRGIHDYGEEDETSTSGRTQWNFEEGPSAAAKRAQLASDFWPAMHVDLRMVDTSDFIVAYCPTNIYSVGTPHEIILARQQRKPVLLVSPPVQFPAFDRLREHLRDSCDTKGGVLLEQLKDQVPIKPNDNGAPSSWYMPLIGGEHFFDGFGFERYQDDFGWEPTALDQREQDNGPKKPLLPFLAALNHELPKKWDRTARNFVSNDDWLLWDLRKEEGGADVIDVNAAARQENQG